MEFTGERVIPGHTDPDLMNEHWARYAFAEALVGWKTVLDAGCGVGYGAERLAAAAARVYALDQSKDALLQAARHYAHPRVSFMQGDCCRLPFPDASLDVVVALEVIEHLKEWRPFLSEAQRVLRPSGQLIVSTPNRLYYGESRAEPNPFHEHEFDYNEFREELSARFPHCTVFLENHTDAITFMPPKVQGVRTKLGGGSTWKPEETHFFLAVCSSDPLHGSPAFVYVPSTANVLRQRERHIQLLDQELRQKTQWLEETGRELEKLSKEHVRDQEQAQQAISKLDALNLEKTQWAEELNQEIASLQGELKRCVTLIDDAEKRVTERSEWAQRLNRELEAIYLSKGYRLSRRLGLVPEPGSVLSENHDAAEKPGSE